MAPLTLTIIINQINVYHVNPQGKSQAQAVSSAIEQFYADRDRYAVIDKHRMSEQDADLVLAPEDDPFWHETLHTINVVESTLATTDLGWGE